MLAEPTPGKPMFMDRKAWADRERSYMCLGAAILLAAIALTVGSVQGGHALVATGFGALSAAFLAASIRIAKAGRAR